MKDACSSVRLGQEVGNKEETTDHIHSHGQAAPRVSGCLLGKGVTHSLLSTPAQ